MNTDSRHTAACQAGELSYIDPSSGYRVFTAIALRARPRCCGCGCRHCPFGHSRVPQAHRQELRQDPWVESIESSSDACDVLYWSGGLESFLALAEMARGNPRPVVLMTTFDGETGMVTPHDIPIDTIKSQARMMSIDLLLTPLYSDSSYIERLLTGLKLLATKRPIRHMAFPDVRLEHVRQWRLDNIGPALTGLGIEPVFPVWQAAQPHLERTFFNSGARAEIASVSDEALTERCQAGDTFDQRWLDALPEGVDRLGERGEFRTLVWPPTACWRELGSLADQAS